jgi:hypothetical protein
MKRILKGWLGISSLQAHYDQHMSNVVSRLDTHYTTLLLHKTRISNLEKEIEELKNPIPLTKTEKDLSEWNGKLDDTTVSALFKFPFKAEVMYKPKRKYVKSGKYSKKGTNNGK